MGCPTCGAPIVAGALFCGNCGTRLVADGEAAASRTPAELTPTAAHITERRVVSVLFADLVGFTTISATRDHESIRELQSAYFDRVREIVARYGGLVEKFIGDAVMAMWGAPTAHEDDAERAVRAALDLVEMVPVLGRELGVDLQLRAGVLTGEAAVAVGAEAEGMVAGDMVNTAARLQSVAQPGTVLVGEATRVAAGQAITFEPAGEQVLKGKPAPVPAWRAMRVVGERGGARRPDAIEPPFVGRTEELRFLKEQFHATGREGKARLVSLVGQAGIGKSRLAWELEKYLDGVVDTVWWHRGRSPSYGEGVTFWALSEMFRRRAGLVESDDAETTRRAVATMVQQVVPDEAERAWIEPRILVLLGVEEAAPGGAVELFAAWRTFFERLASVGTVALVFEDLQWSDDGLLDFLEHLLDWGRSSRIFVLTLARPELLERRAGWGTDRRGATAMRLDPLSDPAMRELLAGVAPALPERVVKRILGRADGIPLYAVETIRTLVTKGQLVERDGVLEVAPDATGANLDRLDLEIPPTLQALVASRLDALPAAERSLLQDAAVLGHSFSIEALTAMTGESPEALAPRLAGLVRREILALETDPRAPSRGQHVFVQGLLREVAVSTLSRRERRARHLTAARYFESLGDEEMAGVVASHFVGAYRAAPDGAEGEAVAAQARVSLVALADRATGLGALVQAIDALRSALEVTPDPAQRAQLLERIGLLQTFHSDWEAGYANLTAAVEAYEALGDRIGIVRATGYLIREHLSAARIADAERLAAGIAAEIETLVTTALEQGADADGPAAETAALLAETMARLEFRLEHRPDAIRWAERAIAIAEPLELQEPVASALVTKGTSLAQSGHLREGIALLEGAVVDARSHGESLPMLRGLNNISSITAAIDPRGSVERTRLGIATAGRLGLRSFDYYHAGNATGAAESLGEWAWARGVATEMLDGDRDEGDVQWLETVRDYFTAWTGEADIAKNEQRLALARQANDYQEQRNVLSFLAKASFAAGDPRHALDLMEPFLEAAHQADLFEFPMVGRYALHAGDLDAARRVLGLIGRGSVGAMTPGVEGVRAGIAALEGRRDDAVALYRSALAAYRSYGMKFTLALTVLDMVKLLGPDDPAAKSVLDEGRGILEELEASALLARLDDLLSGETDGRQARAAAAATR
jgi:class 3 adenylate cyclase/tetratricopeptide (TPR) repeat protein